MSSSPLLSPSREPDSTPRWASQRLYTSAGATHFLTDHQKNFTSPSLMSLSPSHFSPADSFTDLRTGSRRHLAGTLLETNFLLTSSQQRGPSPPPRPPRYSKSLGHIPKTVDQDQRLKRRRSVATCKSSHSLFECSEGCFNVEASNQTGQYVTITTGPILC